MNLPSFTVFHYDLVGDVHVVYYTTTNALFNAEIKTLQLHWFFFDDVLLKPMKVKDDDPDVLTMFALVDFPLERSLE